MISYIFLLFSSLISLYPKNYDSQKDSLYSLIFSSIIFSHISLGFFSLILIHLNLSRFPLIIFCFFILIISLLRRDRSIEKLFEIKIFLKKEVEFLIKSNQSNNFKKSLFILLLILLAFILFSSIGPINHPDAADYHVGYPYQYFVRGRFFIDGGLTQGLLGIGDYANLSFIQEKNIWLIRFIQILNLPLIVLFLSKNVRNNIFLIAFLTVPTFIQWSTIGKPLFLGESTLIILYLIWKDNKTFYNLKLLIISILSCLAYKISALIIIFPITIFLTKYLIKKIYLKEIILNDVKHIFLSKEVLFTSAVLFSIFIDRQIITGNFAFPLLTNFFNTNDPIMNDFSKNIINYQRDGFSFLRIFMTTKTTELSTILGPSILVIYITIIISKLRNLHNTNNEIVLLTTAQILLLISFSQGRSDYYSGPLILIIYSSGELDNIIKELKLKYILNITNIFQSTIISIYLFFSIYQNFLSYQNYSKMMNISAYGFNTATQIDNALSGNIYISGRTTRFYYPENYVDTDQMNRCFNENFIKDQSEGKEICFEKYKINQIITNEKEKINKNIYECKIINTTSPSRNIFKRKSSKIKYCTKKNIFNN